MSIIQLILHVHVHGERQLKVKVIFTCIHILYASDKEKEDSTQQREREREMRVTFVLIRTTRSFLPPQTNNKLKIDKQINTNHLHSYTMLHIPEKKEKIKNK